MYNCIKISFIFFPVRAYKSYVSVGKAGTVGVAVVADDVYVVAADVVHRIRRHDGGNYRFSSIDEQGLIGEFESLPPPIPSPYS